MSVSDSEEDGAEEEEEEEEEEEGERSPSFDIVETPGEFCLKKEVDLLPDNKNRDERSPKDSSACK